MDQIADAAQAFNAVNVVRKSSDGRLHGDMLDGKAMLRALQARGIALRERSVFLTGCGGAGSAMAFSACAAGARTLRLMDIDAGRVSTLAAVLAQRFPACNVGIVQTPGACDVQINATPLGMKLGDPLPIPLDQACPNLAAVDAVTSTGVTPWVASCRTRGIITVDGNELAAAQQPLLLEFFGFG